MIFERVIKEKEKKEEKKNKRKIIVICHRVEIGYGMIVNRLLSISPIL